MTRPFFADSPELFSEGFEKGYEMNGHYLTKRHDVKIKIRRIKLRNGGHAWECWRDALPEMLEFVSATF